MLFDFCLSLNKMGRKKAFNIDNYCQSCKEKMPWLKTFYFQEIDRAFCYFFKIGERTCIDHALTHFKKERKKREENIQRIKKKKEK